VLSAVIVSGPFRYAAHNVAAAVLWRKRQTHCDGDLRKQNLQTENSHVMMLAVTGQWVTEVIVVLCLFGAACIGLVITAGDGGDRATPRTAEQNASERNSTTGRREIPRSDDTR
jgi:hypothetical protein